MDLQTGLLEDRDHAQIFFIIIYYFFMTASSNIKGIKAVKIVEK